MTLYLRLGRLSNLPTVWTNTLAGILLSGGVLECKSYMALGSAFSLFYAGGMYLNDAFDREFDALHRRERPIPSGQISARRVFVLGFGMLFTALAILTVHSRTLSPQQSWASVLSGAALASAIIFYDVEHKNNPLSPVHMGVCRVLVYITAGLAAGGRINAPLMSAALVSLCYLIGLSYAAKQETGTEFRGLWPLGFLCVPFAQAGPLVIQQGAAALVVYAVFLAWVCYSARLLIDRQRLNIPRAAVHLIAGISLLDAMLLSSRGFLAPALAAVLGFALTVLFQRRIPGS